MYPYKYYRYINLPTIPQEIVKNLPKDFDLYTRKDLGRWGDDYKWSDTFNSEINAWCQSNICDEMWWGFQIIKGDLGVHIDHVTKYKFVYLIDTGGDQVITEWFDEDQKTLVDSVILEPQRWHILKVDTYHSVRGIDPNRVRHSVTGRLF